MAVPRLMNRCRISALHVYWPLFARTFDEALAANPMPLPFDGVDWPPIDCSFAP
jgi:hypothetical protein